MDLEFEDIKLDFDLEELKLLDEQQNDLLSYVDFEIENLDQIHCLGAPFFPAGQKHTCTCNEIIQKRLNESKSKAKETINISYEEDMDTCRSKIYDEKGRQQNSKKKSIHIEEFLLELLNAGGYEGYIHWTVKERREFKISRPQRVAALWGDRKSRKLLSDEKLIRALRYAAKKGKLEKSDGQLMLYRFL